MTQKKIDICFIESFPSVSEGIFSLVNISKNQIKQSGLKKAFLNKEIRAKDELSFPINLINRGEVFPQYSGPKIEILFEDENVLVLSKPIRVHSHPLQYDESDNLISFIREHNSKLLEVNSAEYDRGLLYRLDHETSGLIYYIKSNETHAQLRSNFKDLIKEKIYFAVVVGELKDSGKVESKLETSGVKGAQVKVSESGRPCCINYEALEYNSDKNISLIKVFLNEGFKHQIRVQLQSIKHPICGDNLYGISKEFNRMYLHCYQYKFSLNNKEYDIKDDSIKSELQLLFRYFDS
jgi:23S rRNA pseudouridine1911/1915/1917 synthase